LFSKSKKAVIILGAIILFLFVHYQSNICDCKKRISYASINLNRDINLDTLFEPMDTLEYNEVMSSWQNFQSNSDRSSIILKTNYSLQREVHIVEHSSKEQIHFGAVIIPAHFNKDKIYPVLLWTNGLSQSNPSVNLNNSTIRTLASKFKNYFIIVPSYRGQAIVYNRERFCSDGFFGDAFDGAADDALRLLELVISEYPGVDKKRITVCGVSRGGTVALLMGIRNAMIKNVVSIAGPTDLFSEEYFHKFGKLYKYLFLSTTTSIKDIRLKILKSSPIHFLKNYHKSLLMIHGQNDQAVSVSHAHEVNELLKEQANITTIINEDGHRFSDWNLVEVWIKNNN